MSDNFHTGVVEAINKNAKGFYGIKLDNEDSWFGLGKYPPKFEKGDTIEFNYSMNKGFKNIESNTVNVVPAKKSPKPSSGGTDWDAKDKRIQYMSARNAGIETVKLLIEQQAVKLPAKQDAKEQAVSSLIDAYTDRYYLACFDRPFEAIKEQLEQEAITPEAIEEFD